MTLRARPTTKPVNRSHRAPGGDERRNLYMNLGFGAVVVIAILLFAGAAFAGWYGQHLAPAATVNGVTITKDQIVQRTKIEEFRLQVWEDQTRAKANAGHMAGSTAQSIISYIDSVKGQMSQNALQYEEDSELVRQLAAKRNIAISDADVDAQFTKDATTVESRHTFAITIKPALSTGTTTATDAQKQAAKDKAATLLAGLKSGTSWEDTVKASGDTDAATANGELYFIDKGSTSPDTAFVDAIFALTAPGYTDVILGSDGYYRIGRMTDVAAASVDSDFSKKISDAGIDMGTYRNLDKSYVAHDKIDAQLQAEVVTTATEQRRGAQIVLDDNGGSPVAANTYLLRQVLYAPNDNATAAKDLKADDPAWAKAKQEALDAVSKLKAGTATFADLAKTSDDTSSTAKNGYLGWKALGDTTLDNAVQTAVFKAGATTGQLLDPIQGADGWHVVQIMSVDSVDTFIKSVTDQASKQGADIASLATQYSIDASASKGGDMGWIAKYQLDSDTEKAIFALAKGQAAAPADYTGSDGATYQRILAVTDVQTRLPDGDQKATLVTSAFNNWYNTVKNDPAQTTIVELDTSSAASATP